jgi:hypothetical protein
LVACVLHSYLRNDVSIEDCVIENTDAPSHFSYVTFRCTVGSASEEAMSVRESTVSTLKMLGQSLGNWKQ